jgi:hypothetical protein
LASGKKTVADFMKKEGYVDEILSFRELISKTLLSLKLDIEWEIDTIKDYESIYKSMLLHNPLIWSEVMLKRLYDTIPYNVVIYDCMTKREIEWFGKQESLYNIIILSPDTSIHQEMFYERYKKAISHSLLTFSHSVFGEEFQESTYGLMVMKRKNMAVIRLRQKSKEANLLLIKKAIQSIEKGEPSKLW